MSEYPWQERAKLLKDYELDRDVNGLIRDVRALMRDVRELQDHVQDLEEIVGRLLRDRE